MTFSAPPTHLDLRPYATRVAIRVFAALCDPGQTWAGLSPESRTLMERTAALALSNMLDAGYQGGLAAAAEFLIANSSSPAPGRNGLQ